MVSEALADGNVRISLPLRLLHQQQTGFFQSWPFVVLLGRVAGQHCVVVYLDFFLFDSSALRVT